MNKEEILSISRKEKNDEGLRNAENKGHVHGTLAFLFILLFLILFNYFTGQDFHELIALFYAFLSAAAYPKYKFTKQNSYLVITIAGATASICGLINYVIYVLG